MINEYIIFYHLLLHSLRALALKHAKCLCKLHKSSQVESENGMAGYVDRRRHPVNMLPICSLAAYNLPLAKVGVGVGMFYVRVQRHFGVQRRDDMVILKGRWTVFFYFFHY